MTNQFVAFVSRTDITQGNGVGRGGDATQTQRSRAVAAPATYRQEHVLTIGQSWHNGTLKGGLGEGNGRYGTEIVGIPY